MSLWDCETLQGGNQKQAARQPAPAVTKAQEQQSIGGLLGLMPRSGVPRRGDAGLIAAYHSVPSLHGALNLISNRLAEIEWWVTPKGAGPEADRVDHPVIDLIQDPNEEFTGYAWRKMCALYQELAGESFNVRFGEPGDDRIDLLPFPPLSVRRREGAWEVQHNRFRAKIDQSRMVYLKSIDLTDPYGRGIGTARAVADEVEISEYAARHEKSEFANHAQPSFMVFIPGASPEQAKRFKTNWRQMFAGPDQVGKGAFFGGGKEQVQIEQLSRSLKDMTITEVREFSDDVVRYLFGVSPELIGKVQDSNRATSTQAEKILAKNVLKPRLRHQKDGWNKGLLGIFDDGDEFELHHDDPEPDNKIFIFEVMKEQPQRFTDNEWRSVADHPEIEGGDVLMRPDGVEEEIRPKGSPAPQKRKQLPDNVVWMVDYRKQDIDPAELTAEEIASLLEPQLIESEMSPEFEEQLRGWALPTLEQIPGTPPEAFQLLNPRILEEVQRFGAEDIVQINDTTKSQIRGIVNSGFQEGLGPRDVARRIRSDIETRYLPEIIPNRAEVIARTEMLRASNGGTYFAHQVSGVVEAREWIASIDGRQRPTHGDLDSTVVGIGEQFETPNGQAKYPGDFGVAIEDVQCRCTTAAVIDGKVFLFGMKRKDFWKQFDNQLRVAEERFARITREAMMAQVRGILPLIEEIVMEAA